MVNCVVFVKLVLFSLFCKVRLRYTYLKMGLIKGAFKLWVFVTFGVPYAIFKFVFSEECCGEDEGMKEMERQRNVQSKTDTAATEFETDSEDENTLVAPETENTTTRRSNVYVADTTGDEVSSVDCINVVVRPFRANELWTEESVTCESDDDESMAFSEDTDVTVIHTDSSLYPNSDHETTDDVMNRNIEILSEDSLDNHIGFRNCSEFGCDCIQSSVIRDLDVPISPIENALRQQSGYDADTSSATSYYSLNDEQ